MLHHKNKAKMSEYIYKSLMNSLIMVNIRMFTNKKRNSFSYREGFKPLKEIIQNDDVDNELRNGLWDVLLINCWNFITREPMNGDIYGDKSRGFFMNLWHDYFKEPIDTIDWDWNHTYKQIRDYFFNCDWDEVYSFLEHVANSNLFSDNSENFKQACNDVLERELSGFRFVGNKILKITSEEEISGIEEALKSTTPLKPVNEHLNQALELLADRKSPDYRNSIKESISAVESICLLITKDKEATLTSAIDKIEGKTELNKELKDAFKKLYWYTSYPEGIRHALIDEPNIDFEDAKFMLVSCSAFVNYLIVKAQKANIKL